MSSVFPRRRYRTLLYMTLIAISFHLGGCALWDRGERFDDSFGEAGQGLRHRDPDGGGQWGFNNKARQIEENLGF